MRFAATVVALMLSGGAMADTSADGLWRTEAGDAGTYLTVEIGACEDDATRHCGVIVDLIETTGETGETEHSGKLIIENMRPVSDKAGQWHKGTIWAPDDDKTYKSKMSLVDGGLSVSGCVFGGLICRSQTWLRVE